MSGGRKPMAGTALPDFSLPTQADTVGCISSMPEQVVDEEPGDPVPVPASWTRRHDPEDYQEIHCPAKAACLNEPKIINAAGMGCAKCHKRSGRYLMEPPKVEVKAPVRRAVDSSGWRDAYREEQRDFDRAVAEARACGAGRKEIQDATGIGVDSVAASIDRGVPVRPNPDGDREAALARVLTAWVAYQVAYAEARGARRGR